MKNGLYFGEFYHLCPQSYEWTKYYVSCTCTRIDFDTFDCIIEYIAPISLREYIQFINSQHGIIIIEQIVCPSLDNDNA